MDTSLFSRFLTFLSCFFALLSSSLSIDGDAPSVIKSSLEYEYPHYGCAAQEVDAVVTIQAPTKPAKQTPLSLTTVLDVSGSMRYRNRLKLMQLTADFIARQLAKTTDMHQLGIVTFNGRVFEWAKLGFMNQTSLPYYLERINATRATGVTALMEGIQKGIKQQASGEEGDFVRAVLVLTDGVPQGGETDRKKIKIGIKTTLDATGRKIAIYTFGLGSSLAMDLLEDIAHIGYGVRYIVPREPDIPKAFGDALAGLMSMVAENILVKLIPQKGAKLVYVRSAANLVKNADGSYHLYYSDLFAEERRDSIIRLRLPRNCADGSYLDVEGEFLATSDYEKKYIPILHVPIKRSPKPPKFIHGAEITQVCLVTFAISIRISEAARLLTSPNMQSCIKMIDETIKFAMQSSVVNSTIVQYVISDMRVMKQDMLNKKCKYTICRIQLEGIRDAIQRQRTGLTDLEKFKIVATAKSSLSIRLAAAAEYEVSRRLSGPIEAPVKPTLTVAPSFNMKFNYSIADSTINGQYKEIDIVVTIHAPEMNDSHASLSLTTVLDRSGSMKGAPFELLKSTQKFVLDTFKDQKNGSLHVGMVFFSDKAEVFQKITSIDDVDVAAVKKSLDAVEASGAAALADGLFLAVDQQSLQKDYQGLKVIFLFTDGVPSNKSDIGKDLKAKLDSLSSEKILIYTFGLGKNVDAALLRTISEIGGGRYYFLQTKDDLPLAFGDALGGLLSLAAKNITISMTPYDDVEILKVFPEAHSKGMNKTVHYSNLFIDEKREVLVKVRVPIRSKAESLLDCYVGYTEVKTNQYVVSDQITIKDAKPSPEAQRRLLEVAVVQYLGDCEIFSEAGNYKKVTEILTEAIVYVSESSKSIDKQYVADLVSDLTTLKTKSERGSLMLVYTVEVTTNIQVLRQILITQRRTAVTTVAYHVETYYDTEARKQLRKDFSENVTTEGVMRPQFDAVSIQYESKLELTNNKSEAVIPITLIGVNKPTSKPGHATYVGYVVDYTKNTTDEEKSRVQELIIKSIESYSESGDLQEESLCFIIFISSTVTTVVSRKRISEMSATRVREIFMSITSEGHASFAAGLAQSVDEIKAAGKDKNVILVPIAGKSVLDSDAALDAAAFQQMVQNISSPITVVPISQYDEVIKDYFGAFSEPAQKHAKLIDCDTCIKDAVTEMTKVASKLAAKEINLQIKTSAGVKLISVDGKVPSETGSIIISDVFYGEHRSVSVKVRVEAHDGVHPLFNVSSSYYDVRSLHVWETEEEPLAVTRVPEKVIKTRQATRLEVNKTLDAVDEALRKGSFAICYTVIVQQIASITKIESYDKELIYTKTALVEILQQIQEAAEGIRDVKKVQAHLDFLRQTLDVHTCESNPVPEEPKQTPKAAKKATKLEKKFSVPHERQFAFKAVFPSGDRITNSPQSVSPKLTIAVPVCDGKLVNGRSAIIVDTSKTANMKQNVQVVKVLLEQLSSKAGKDHVKILSWNEVITTVYESEDIKNDQVAEAVKKVEEIQLSGDCLYRPVIDHGLYHATSGEESDVETAFIIVSSTSKDSEDHETLIESGKSVIGSVLESVMIFTFAGGLDPHDESVKTVEEITAASGGAFFVIEESSKVVESVARIMHLITTTVYKNVEISVDADQAVNWTGATVDGFKSATENGALKISHVQCHDRKNREVVVGIDFDVGYATGTQELVKISGRIFNLKTKRSELISSLSYLMERIDEEDLEELVRLEKQISTLLSTAQEFLSKKQLSKVLATMHECAAFVTYAKIKSTYLLQDTKSSIQTIIRVLKICIQDDAPSALKMVSQFISDLKKTLTGAESHPDNMEKLLAVPPVEKLTFSDEAGMLKIPIWIVSPVAINTFPAENYTITAVLDAAVHDAKIENAASLLDVQKNLLSSLIHSLVVDHSSFVNLTIIVAKRAAAEVIDGILIGASNIDDLEETLKPIKTSGQAVGLIDNLELALSTQSQNVKSTQRTILLFSEASSICCLNEDLYESILQKHNQKPLNPIRILTYILGKTADNRWDDPISGLTGGARTYITSGSEIEPAVQMATDLLTKSICRHVRLTLTPVSWLKEDFSFSPWSYVKRSANGYHATVLDVPMGEKIEMQAKVEVGAWNGNAEMFTCSVSYFRTDVQQWMKESEISFVIHRSSEKSFLAIEDETDDAGKLHFVSGVESTNILKAKNLIKTT